MLKLIFFFQILFLTTFSNAQLLTPKGKSSFMTTLMNVTVIAKFNERVYLQAPVFQFSETNYKGWVLAKPNEALAIYNSAIDGKLLVKTRFSCEPSIDTCNSLIINTLNEENVGEYLRKSESTDNLRDSKVSYYVSAYQGPLNMICPLTSASSCKFNATSGVLSVKEKETINFKITANIATRAENELPVELYFRSNSYQDECANTENKQIIIRQKNDALPGLTQIGKECSRVFKPSDSQYKIGLRYNGDVNSNADIDTLDVLLDVHYGPVRDTNQQLAHTVSINDEIRLECPFSGNPIAYYFSAINSKNAVQCDPAKKVCILPKQATVGEFQFECEAYVSGMINNRTNKVTFTVKTVDNRSTSPKKNNLGAIIGGAVGGVVGLLLIALLVILVLRCRRNGNKDDVDKAKETKNKPKSILKGAPKPIYKPVNKNNPDDDEVQIKKPPPSITTSSKIINQDNIDETLPLNKTPPTPSKRGNTNQSQPPVVVKTYPKFTDHTKGATEVLKKSLSDSDESEKDASYGAYSPSVAESRQKDAAAPGANLSVSAKALSTSKQNLAKMGGFKVLPTSENGFKLNQNPGESPPSYDAALKQTNDSPKTLTKPYHTSNNNLLLNRDPQSSGSNAKLTSQYNVSDKNLNNIQYSDVVNISNNARSRNPLPMAPNNANNAQQPQTQYSSVQQFSIQNPTIV